MDSTDGHDHVEGAPPDATPPDAPAQAPPLAPPAARTDDGWNGGRVVGLVFASIGGLIGAGLLLGGLALIAVHAFVRDDDGFYTVGESLEARSYAIATDKVDLGAGPADPAPSDALGTIRVSARSTTRKPIFVGIARTQDVERYLRGVGHAKLTGWSGASPDYDYYRGSAPRARPGSLHIWVARSQGPGKRTVDWDSQAGIWSVVIMNSDGSRGVSVHAEVGAQLGWLIWVAVGLAIVGLVLLIVAILLVVHISRRASRASTGHRPNGDLIGAGQGANAD